MRPFVKKYIKPILCTMGIYTPLYRLYFLLLSNKRKAITTFHKLFYRTAPILLYHRIDTLQHDPVMLAVTPKCFDEHLSFLKKHYDVVALSELSKRIRNKTLKGNEVAITFDDGYRDNLTNALPLLEKYNLPATIFITTQSLGEKASFRWDMGYSESERASFLSDTEIRTLYNHPLITIGAHSKTHPRLIELIPEEQEKDILEGKIKLEEITGGKITMFAYPFGGVYDFDNTTEKIVAKLGFDFAYSNEQNLATITSNTFHIPRINIRECNVTSLSKKL